MRQALKLARKRAVGHRRFALLVRDQLNRAVARTVLLRGLAAAHEIARVCNGRAPVIGEALEVGERKARQILAGDAHNAKLAQCGKQKFDLPLIEMTAQIDAV